MIIGKSTRFGVSLPCVWKCNPHLPTLRPIWGPGPNGEPELESALAERLKPCVCNLQTPAVGHSTMRVYCGDLLASEAIVRRPH